MITAYMMNLMNWRQEQARQMQQFMQALAQLGQAVGGAANAYKQDQAANTEMNTINPPRAALVSPNPSDPDQQAAMDEFQAQNPNMNTTGTQPFTGGKAGLGAYLAANRQMGGRGAQPYVPGQNPVTDYQRAKAIQGLNAMANPPSNGYAAQSAANLQGNMSQVMNPDQLAGGSASDVNSQLQQVQPTPTADAAGKAAAALKQANGTMGVLSGGKIKDLGTFEQLKQYAQTDPSTGMVTVGGHQYTAQQWQAMMNHYSSVQNAGSAATTAIAGSQSINPQTGVNAQNMGNAQTSIASQYFPNTSGGTPIPPTQAPVASPAPQAPAAMGYGPLDYNLAF